MLPCFSKGWGWRLSTYSLMRRSCSIWVDCIALSCLVSVRITAAVLLNLETLASFVRLVHTTKLIRSEGCLGVCWLALLIYQYSFFIPLFSCCQAPFLNLFARLILQLHASDNHRIFNWVSTITLHNIKANWIITKHLIVWISTRIKI